jgi:hypothetical protein
MNTKSHLLLSCALAMVAWANLTCNDVAPTAAQTKTIQQIISIQFDQPSCTFTLAQAGAGVQVGYHIIISDNVDTIFATDLATCGAPDSTGLIPFEEIYGNNQKYCLCDKGLCFYVNGGYLSKLVKGTYSKVFQWQGRNWYGPSDTMNPQGAPFPAGSYTLKVSVAGRSKVNGVFEDFTVSDSISVMLTN